MMKNSSSKLHSSTAGRHKKAKKILLGSSKHATIAKSGISGSKELLKRPDLTVTIKDVNGEDITPVQLFRAYNRNESSNDLESSDSVNNLLNNLESIGASTDSSSVVRSVGDFGQGSQASTHSVVEKSNNELEEIEPTTIHAHEAVDEEIDPNTKITIQLIETYTIELFSMVSKCVNADAGEEVLNVKAQNEKYKELKQLIPNNDNYISRTMQTLKAPTKQKDSQTVPFKKVHVETTAIEWDIYDTYVVEEVQADEKLRALEDLEHTIHLTSSELKTNESQILGGSTRESISNSEQKSELTQSRASASIRPEISRGPVIKQITPTSELVLNTKNELLLDNLYLAERAVVGNTYEKKLISFRNVPDQADLEKKRVDYIFGGNEDEEKIINTQKEVEVSDDLAAPNVPVLQNLWTFRCDLTRGRQVTYMCYNKQNEDIIAVAYGESRLQNDVSPGLVLCWSAKNPEWPDKVYNCQSPCISLDFSKLSPGLLAAGFTTGRIIIYDVRQPGQKIVADNETNGKHRDPVWELKWVEKERIIGDEHSKTENLISVSSDGRVTQWTMRKGFEFTDLMLLKRMTKQKKSSNGTVINTNSFISRQTGGLCIDFNSKDSNSYLVGTEDGQIHRCSSAYNEQYLSTYSNHTAPVVKVKWSPFLPSVFISCSADWTARLWSQDAEEVFKFQSGKDAITDISWSPQKATLFGSVSQNGKLEIWDLEYSSLDPTITHAILDRQLTSILFGARTPTVITGDDYGAVTVYKLCNHPSQTDDPNSNGCLSEYAAGPVTDKKVMTWRQEQAQALQMVINSKISSGSLVGQ